MLWAVAAPTQVGNRQPRQPGQVSCDEVVLANQSALDERIADDRQISQCQIGGIAKAVTVELEVALIDPSGRCPAELVKLWRLAAPAETAVAVPGVDQLWVGVVAGPSPRGSRRREDAAIIDKPQGSRSLDRGEDQEDRTGARHESRLRRWRGCLERQRRRVPRHPGTTPRSAPRVARESRRSQSRRPSGPAPACPASRRRTGSSPTDAAWPCPLPVPSPSRRSVSRQPGPRIVLRRADL